MVYKWLEQALAWVFPFNCIVCERAAGETGMDLCAACREDLPWLGRACFRCANPLAAAAPVPEPTALVCGRCLRQAPHFERSHCVFNYGEPVSWVLHGLKYQRRLSGVPVLSRLLLEHLRTRVERWPELIVPMPLHAARLRQRGFNQALEIARPLARALGIPLGAGICERKRNTAQQSELPASRRAANVRNAFRMRGALTVKHVAIVDDVITTGATVNELARLLKRNGAETVQIWAIARTPVNFGNKR
ncbi:MAG TPA: ComF family protein [Gammaproteobacteria bacterium]|nr:ComF family protein [Gammaproteobacteria bacterium]